MVILFYMYLIQKFCSILYLLKDCYFLLWFSVTCKVTVNYLSQSACFQGCHNLQRMDLEECVLVSIIVQCHLGFREPFQEFKEENEIMFHSCGTKSSFCLNKIVWLFFCPFQITDSTLNHLSLWCSGLEKLVSIINLSHEFSGCLPLSLQEKMPWEWATG